MDRRTSAKDIASSQSQKLFSIASGYYRSGLFEEAEKTYRKLLVDEPRHADALFLLASITHRTGRDEDALDRALSLATRMSPNFTAPARKSMQV